MNKWLLIGVLAVPLLYGRGEMRPEGSERSEQRPESHNFSQQQQHEMESHHYNENHALSPEQRENAQKAYDNRGYGGYGGYGGGNGAVIVAPQEETTVTPDPNTNPNNPYYPPN